MHCCSEGLAIGQAQQVLVTRSLLDQRRSLVQRRARQDTAAKQVYRLQVAAVDRRLRHELGQRPLTWR